MRAVAYLRVSTDKQAEEGNGLDVQERMCRAWARRTRHDLVAVHTDAGVSGTRPADERPGLGAALDVLHSGAADALVVRDLDRLARAVTVQEAVLADVWRRPGAQVFTVTSGEVLRDDPDDPMRTAMREMAGVFAGLERRMLVKRMRDGRKAKAARGGHAVGAAPYGWEAVAGELLPVPDEQTVLRRIRRAAQRGASTRTIADALNADGIPTKRAGGRWSSPTVSRLLTRTSTPPRKALP